MKDEMKTPDFRETFITFSKRDLPPLFGPLPMVVSPTETAPGQRSTLLVPVACNPMNYGV